MWRILVTHFPEHKGGGEFGPSTRALSEPRLFYGFRSPTDRGRWGRGNVAEVVLYSEGKHGRGPKTWTTREAAERNVHHLIARGYTARVEEI